MMRSRWGEEERRSGEVSPAASLLRGKSLAERVFLSNVAIPSVKSRSKMLRILLLPVGSSSASLSATNAALTT